jgi:enoyl-CoA hydratase/carnithine racemase
MSALACLGRRCWTTSPPPIDDELDEESVRIASRLAAVPPTAMKLTKLALNRTYERTSVLFVTHNIEEAVYLSDTVDQPAASREAVDPRRPSGVAGWAAVRP